MSEKMSDEEWVAFLGDGTKTAKLATVRKDGRPHVLPVWIALDDQKRIVFTTAASSLKGKALQRDPRVCLCVDDERPPFAFVMVDGIAEVSSDLEEMLFWATKIGGRYMGEENAEAFGQRNAVESELLVKVTPTNVFALRDISG